MRRKVPTWGVKSQPRGQSAGVLISSCCVTNCPQSGRLTTCTLTISQFLWLRDLCVALLVLGLTRLQPEIGQSGVLAAGSIGERATFKQDFLEAGTEGVGVLSVLGRSGQVSSWTLQFSGRARPVGRGSWGPTVLPAPQGASAPASLTLGQVCV